MTERTVRDVQTEGGDVVNQREDILNTKGVTVAYDHPTPVSDWQCAGHDQPEIFAPTNDSVLAMAVTMCSGCGAREVCLRLGIARGEWGVWGGVLLEDGKPVAKVRKRGRPPKAAAAA